MMQAACWTVANLVTSKRGTAPGPSPSPTRARDCRKHRADWGPHQASPSVGLTGAVRRRVIVAPGCKGESSIRGPTSTTIMRFSLVLHSQFGSRTERTMTGSAKVWRWAALASSAVLSAIVFWGPDPDRTLRSALAIHDFGHVVAFGLVSALFAFALSVQTLPTSLRRVRATSLSAVAATLVGIAVEFAQAASGGNGDPWDMVRNGGGALSAALLIMSLGRRAYRPSIRFARERCRNYFHRVFAAHSGGVAGRSSRSRAISGTG